MGRELWAGSPSPPKRTVTVPSSLAGGGDVVDAVGAGGVGLEEAVGVVDRDGPEAVDGDVADGEAVLAHGQTGLNADVGGLGVGQSTPAGCGADQVVYGVDVLPAPETAFKGLHPGRQGQ